MYHRVAEESFDPWGLAVSPAHFREQLKWLSENRSVLRLEDFAGRHRQGTLPHDAIAVTFDDGYACNGEVAAPLLEQFGIPATIFLPVDLIEKGEPFWWDELEEMVLEHSDLSFTLAGREIQLGARTASDRLWPPETPARTPRQAAFEGIHAHLSRMAPGDRDSALESVRQQAGRPELKPKSPFKQPMTVEQIRRTADRGVAFGSHTLTHPWLTSLDEPGQRKEIVDSVDKCRALTGSRPATFAYPFGAFNRQSERLAEEAGFECACATKDIAVSRRSRRFTLPRVPVGNTDAAGLQRMLARVRSE